MSELMLPVLMNGEMFGLKTIWFCPFLSEEIMPVKKFHYEWNRIGLTAKLLEPNNIYS